MTSQFTYTKNEYLHLQKSMLIRVNEQKQKISGSLTNHGGKKMGLYVFCKTCMMIVLLEWRTLNSDTAVIKKQLLMEKFKNQYCEEMLAIRAIDKQKKYLQ
ncbi:hypothetical protein T05_1638 [Trichinella murrelli]|uniref:Uncharacterized protein n=1 Tax=Trichinella murrelli TaxID=144512 RepID=A0A0V0UGC3_9BILA|nr:hypothetical protein T05_1638 [Trichinella murrelli]